MVCNAFQVHVLVRYRNVLQQLVNVQHAACVVKVDGVACPDRHVAHRGRRVAMSTALPPKHQVAGLQLVQLRHGDVVQKPTRCVSWMTCRLPNGGGGVVAKGKVVYPGYKVAAIKACRQRQMEGLVTDEQERDKQDRL